MRNCRGFTTIEALAVFSVFLMVSVSLLPSFLYIKLEDQQLLIKRQVLSQLHDDLIEIAYGEHQENPENHNHQESKMGVEVMYTFTKETELTKGCAEWKDAKQKEHEVCLYAFPAKQ
ncbi:type II secretion system protein [Sediminibacillus terrae]|uniref:type II secretion system protein n=1 Tax=Sediminibacillus terrae TaxID=1562106 RepID=UPI000424ABD1|nr:type II secretion system protein [Sediminibacillus terrae]